MTAATLSRLPLSAGGAAAASLARGVYWVLNRLIDFGYLVAGQFMRAPVAISTIAAIVGFSLLAGGNALYFQANRHPAPLFFAPPRHVAPALPVKPVVPATRHPQAAIDNETTGSLGNAAPVDTIDNTDVMILQRKLAALKFFDGTADGIFGRRTATAIKAFEIKAGLKPRGKLTKELLAMVSAAPLPTAEQSIPATTTVADTASMTSDPATVIRPPQNIAAQAAPVPLAPARRTVATQQVATAAPVSQADTFSANSVPAASDAPTAPAVAPASVAASAPLAATQETAAPAVAAVDDPASDSSVVAMNNLPSDKATLPVEPSTTVQQAAAPPAQSPAPAPADMASLTPAQRLAAQIGTLPPAATTANVASTAAAPAADNATAGVASSDPGDDAGSTDPALITKIQRGLASLGFLAQKIDGVPGEGTAKAIRNFEVFYDYRVTGLATPQLLNLLVQHGAQT